MPAKEKCFIIMPITTTEAFIPMYRDGKEHFKHVLECLFIPAVEKAGFVAEPPIAKGSDLIHAEIIKIIEKAEIVLCDMSSLNPNVFFEFGIRTSLNKPVCVVKDELTKQVPFDASLLNYQEYDSSLDPWKLNVEIEKVVAHLKTSVERSKGENTLWKYFGIKTEAVPLKSETDTDSKLEYLTYQIETIRQQIEALPALTIKSPPLSSVKKDEIITSVYQLLSKALPKDILIIGLGSRGDDKEIQVHYQGDLDPVQEKLLKSSVILDFGYTMKFIKVSADRKVVK